MGGAERGRGYQVWAGLGEGEGLVVWVGSVTQRWVCLLREVVQEEVVPSGLPQHTVRNLPPFTNVSLLLLLSNPEGRRESAELLLLTDQDGRRRPRPLPTAPPSSPPTH